MWAVTESGSISNGNKDGWAPDCSGMSADCCTLWGVEFRICCAGMVAYGEGKKCHNPSGDNQELSLETSDHMLGYGRTEYWSVPWDCKTKAREKTRSTEKVAQYTCTIGQTNIQQNSQGTQTTSPQHQKHNGPTLPCWPDTNRWNKLLALESNPEAKTPAATHTSY